MKILLSINDQNLMQTMEVELEVEKGDNEEETEHFINEAIQEWLFRNSNYDIMEE